MSKFDEKVEKYVRASEALGLDLDRDLIAATARSLGPAIFLVDEETVVCSDPAEREKIRESFLKKRAGLEADDARIDRVIREICDKLGSAEYGQYRALVCAMLVRHFALEDAIA